MDRFKQYPYFLCFAFSFLVHLALLKGMGYYLNPSVPTIPPPQLKPKITMRFVDTYQDEDKKPAEQTDLISDKNNIASQDKKPDKPVADKSSPYKEKRTDHKQIKTADPRQKSGQVPQVMQPIPPNQSPQISNVYRTKLKKSEESFIKEEVFEQHDKTVYKPETVIEKTTKTPEEDEKKAIDPKADITPQQSVSPQPPVATAGGNSKSDVSLDGKIDELINSEQTDLEALSEILKEMRFNVIKNDLGEYDAKIKKTISRNWRTRITVGYSTEMFASEAVVLFKILENGEIGFIETVYHDGNPFFAHDCELAIKAAEKYDPLPDFYIQKSGKNYLWLIINFGYNTPN